MRPLALILLWPLACSTTVIQTGGGGADGGLPDVHADAGASDVDIPSETGLGAEATNPAETGGHGSVDSGLGGGGGGPKVPPDAGGGSAGQVDASSEPSDAAGGAPGEPDGAPSDAPHPLPDGWLSLADGYAYPPPPEGEVYPPGCPETKRCFTGMCLGALDNKPGGGTIGAPCCWTICTCGADWGSGCEKIVSCLGHPEAPHCI